MNLILYRKLLMFIAILELYIIPRHVDALSKYIEEKPSRANAIGPLLKNSVDRAYEVSESYVRHSSYHNSELIFRKLVDIQ